MTLLQGTTKCLVITEAVAISAFLFQSMTGWGYHTTLSQLIAISGWLTVAKVASPEYADQSGYSVAKAIAFLGNAIAYLLPAAIIYWATRKWPKLCYGLLLTWLAFYLSALFYLFPARPGL